MSEIDGSETDTGAVVITGYFPERRVTHDARCANPCPDLDLTSEHAIHCTEWPEPEHCSRCRRFTLATPDPSPAALDRTGEGE